jgi:hypothetical protein
MLTHSLGKLFLGRLSCEEKHFQRGLSLLLGFHSLSQFSYKCTVIDLEIQTIVATRISPASITSKKYIAYHQQSLV